MKLSDFIVDRQMGTPKHGPYPSRLNEILSAPMAEEAFSEISSWTGYVPTPLKRLSPLARALNVADIAYKDESERFCLGSFRALGGAYAVLRFAVEHLEKMTGTRPSLSSIHGGAYIDALKTMTVAAATDGNHGAAVAWGAQLAGCDCRVYLTKNSAEHLHGTVESLGAKAIVVDGGLEEAHRLCLSDAATAGWVVVSDTSRGNRPTASYEVMAGYSVVASEALAQTESRPPTHVFLQAGIGGLAASVSARFWQVLGNRRPRLIIAEPAGSQGFLTQMRLAYGETPNSPTDVPHSSSDLSRMAWSVLSLAGDAFLTINVDAIGPIIRLLAKGAAEVPIMAGNTAGLGLLSAISAASDPALRKALDIRPDSRFLTIGTEKHPDESEHAAILGMRSPLDDTLRAAIT